MNIRSLPRAAPHDDPFSPPPARPDLAAALDSAGKSLAEEDRAAAAAAPLARRSPKSKGSHMTSVPTALPQAVPRLSVPITGPDMEGMVLCGSSSPKTLFLVARLACASRSTRGR